MTPEQDRCVDCGAVVALCDHVIGRMLDPVVSFQGKVIGELQDSVRSLTAERDEARAHVDRLTVRLAAADRLADEGEALLRHFRRHTSHRCEIDRDAEDALAAYRAARSATGADEGGGA